MPIIQPINNIDIKENKKSNIRLAKCLYIEKNEEKRVFIKISNNGTLAQQGPHSNYMISYPLP